jgi:hypothetical protein
VFGVEFSVNYGARLSAVDPRAIGLCSAQVASLGHDAGDIETTDG